MLRAGQTFGDVARYWNELGITTPYGNTWGASEVQRTLRNPAYCGHMRYGKKVRAKFRRVHDDETLVENAHEGLISPALFHEVDAIVERRIRHHTRRPRGGFPLSGLVHCDVCGSPMHGGSIGRGDGRAYRCFGYRRTAKRTKDRHTVIEAARLEQCVYRKIEEHVLCDKAAEAIRRSIEKQRRRLEESTAAEEAKLMELRKKIAKGVENLALASADNIPAIERLLDEWRQEEQRLVEEIAEKLANQPPDPGAAKVVGNLSKLRKNLSQADKGKLIDALRQTIKRVTVGSSMVGRDGGRHREWHGTVEFVDALGLPPVEITQADIGLRRQWQEVADYIRQSKYPVTAEELLGHFKVVRGTLNYHLRRAVAAGLVRKSSKGWTAA
jgi:hypothetical protein